MAHEYELLGIPFKYELHNYMKVLSSYADINKHLTDRLVTKS